jgi:histidine triad (HIT) family protein
MDYDSNNIFARLLRNEISTDRIWEDEYTIAFRDINPVAPVHVLIIPKGTYVSYDDFVQSASDQEIAGFFRAVRHVAHDLGVSQSGYRLITNHGDHGMQTVPHFHVHLIAGAYTGPLVASDLSAVHIRVCDR